MNSKPLIVILVLICVGLGLGWIFHSQTARREFDQQQAADANSIEKFSNNWAAATAQLKEQKDVNVVLESTLSNRVADVIRFSNQVTQVSFNLAAAQQNAKAAAAAARAEMAKRDAKIADLESQRDDLTKRMTDLNDHINTLQGKIADTEKKLAASEGDRDFLLKELKRLQTEKAELERQFNNLATLRAQVRKLRRELTIARRLDWLRRGFFGSNLKGAERLNEGFAAAQAPKAPRYDLDVELRQDGAARIISTSTNAPAGNSSGGAAPK